MTQTMTLRLSLLLVLKYKATTKINIFRATCANLKTKDALKRQSEVFESKLGADANYLIGNSNKYRIKINRLLMHDSFVIDSGGYVGVR
jgi:hypothetical protein